MASSLIASICAARAASERPTGEPHLAPHPLEQRHSRILLELRELLRHGRGADAARLRDRGEAAVRLEREQQAEAPDIEHRRPAIVGVQRV